MNYIKIKNRKGISPKCSCGTWLEHYKKKAYTIPNYCVERGCMEKPTVGAHVHEPGSDETFIVPFCTAHDSVEDAIEIGDFYLIVSATPC